MRCLWLAGEKRVGCGTGALSKRLLCPGLQPADSRVPEKNKAEDIMHDGHDPGKCYFKLEVRIAGGPLWLTGQV